MENHSDKPIIIDFFGAPGSGKTTISHLIAGKFEERGYKVDEHIFRVNSVFNNFNRKTVKICTAALFTLKHYSYVKDFFSSLDRGTFKSWNDLVTQWINLCFVLDSLARKSNHDIVIAEQGISQAIVSLAAKGKNDLDELFEKLESRIPANIIYVHVQADIEEVLYRLEHRNEGTSDVELEYDLLKKELLLNQITAVCREIKQVKKCVTFDNTMDIESAEHFHHTMDEQLDSLLKMESKKEADLKTILF